MSSETKIVPLVCGQNIKKKKWNTASGKTASMRVRVCAYSYERQQKILVSYVYVATPFERREKKKKFKNEAKV